MLTFEFLYGGYIAIYLINSVEKAMFYDSLPYRPDITSVTQAMINTALQFL